MYICIEFIYINIYNIYLVTLLLNSLSVCIYIIYPTVFYEHRFLILHVVTITTHTHIIEILKPNRNITQTITTKNKNSLHVIKFYKTTNKKIRIINNKR